MGRKNGRMGPLTKGSTKKEKSRGKGSLFGLTGLSIKELGKITRCMARECLSGWTEGSTQGITISIRSRGTEFSDGPTVECMKGTGLTGNNMARGNSRMKWVQLPMGFGRAGKNLRLCLRKNSKGPRLPLTTEVSSPAIRKREKEKNPIDQRKPVTVIYLFINFPIFVITFQTPPSTQY